MNNSEKTSSDSPLQKYKKIAGSERAAIIKDFRTQLYFEMDNDLHPQANRRASEIALMYYISVGDLSQISSFIENQPFRKEQIDDPKEVQIGDLSDKPLKQALSLAITAITMFTRAALDGGLPETIAYSLSDAYIRSLLNINDVDKLYALMNCALYDFAFEVHNYKYKKCSKPVRICCEYILRHLHDDITLSKLSTVCGKSTGYISDCFYKDLGIRPIQFIRSQKLQYARSALKSSDISVSALSDLLAFPSTSSFISYFKKEYGITPSKYKAHSTSMLSM